MFDHVGFSLLYRAVSFRDLFNAELRRIGDFDYLINAGTRPAFRARVPFGKLLDIVMRGSRPRLSRSRRQVNSLLSAGVQRDFVPLRVLRGKSSFTTKNTKRHEVDRAGFAGGTLCPFIC